jgi:hypothetical protein
MTWREERRGASQGELIKRSHRRHKKGGVMEREKDYEMPRSGGKGRRENRNE